MTLRIRRMFSGGKIEKGSYKDEKYSPRQIKNAIDKLAPGMLMTARLQPEQDYTISFDISKHNVYLEKKLKALRKKGVDFNFYRASDETDKYEIDAVDSKGSKIKDRLFIEFHPKDDIEWAWIRGMFGLPSQVTNEVSTEQDVETVSDR